MFLSWIYVFTCFSCFCVCLASCQVCWPEFLPPICPCTHPSLLPPVHPVIRVIIHPLAILTFPSHLSLSIFICHPHPSTHLSTFVWKMNGDCFNGSMWISLLHFTKGITGAEGTRTRKWKWLELDHFCFARKSGGTFRIDLVAHPDTHQGAVNIMDLGQCCFKYCFARNPSLGNRINKSYCITSE